MNIPAKVLLITGPAGSGKSTLAHYVANQLGWLNISEDEYWVQNGWRGHRTEEQEQHVQLQVAGALFHALRAGNGVVLEFILYKRPPNPLTNYQQLLRDHSIPFKTVVLKSPVDEIKQRLLKRGRPNDVAKIDERMRDVVSQLALLKSDVIDPDWVIDNTNRTVEELYAQCLPMVPPVRPSLVAPLTLSAVNALDRDAFISALAGLFEGPPWIVAAAWPARPFASRGALHQALCAIMYAAPEAEQVALLRAHPDLVGRAARAGTLSSASTGEQTAAGLDRLTLDEIASFDQLNREYRERFDFPFVICARENKKDSILAGFAVRLQHSRAQEIRIALGEVAKICALRLRDLIRDDLAPTGAPE